MFSPSCISVKKNIYGDIWEEWAFYLWMKARICAVVTTVYVLVQVWDQSDSKSVNKTDDWLFHCIISQVKLIETFICKTESNKKHYGNYIFTYKL